MPSEAPRFRPRVWPALACLAISLLLYVPVVPHYQRIVIEESRLLLKALPGGVRVVRDDRGNWGTRHPGSDGPITLGGARYGLGAFLALALVPPLLAFARMSLREHLRAQAAGLILVHALHVLMISAYAAIATLSCGGAMEGAVCANVKGSLIYANYPAAVVVWWGLTWKHWLEAGGVPAGAPAPGTEAGAARKDGAIAPAVVSKGDDGRPG